MPRTIRLRVSTDEEEIYFSSGCAFELRPRGWEEKKVKHANGQEVDISTAATNELYVNRVNAINYLWAWLLEVEPRGQYGNAWVVPQVGVTEYDITMFSMSAFSSAEIRGLLKRNISPENGRSWIRRPLQTFSRLERSFGLTLRNPLIHLHEPS